MKYGWQCCVSFSIQQSDSVIHVHISILFKLKSFFNCKAQTFHSTSVSPSTMHMVIPLQATCLILAPPAERGDQKWTSLWVNSAMLLQSVCFLIGCSPLTFIIKTIAMWKIIWNVTWSFLHINTYIGMWYSRQRHQNKVVLFLEFSVGDIISFLQILQVEMLILCLQELFLFWDISKGSCYLWPWLKRLLFLP